MKSILVSLHVPSNTGYAIGPLERLFYRMALNLTGGDPARIHFCYPTMANGPSPQLPADFGQYLVTDMRSEAPADHARAADYVRGHGIDTLFGFDLGVTRPIYRSLRAAGVRHMISYWGAPMSSINTGLKRWLKQLSVALSRHGPDHYVFESRGMAETAVLGRGIPANRTSVVYLGVDTERFRPDLADARQVYQRLSLPPQRRIFFYSGHMEPRKGVAVIMQAANRVAARRGRDDWHVLLLGNKGDEHLTHAALLSEQARDRVTFGGYRSDLDVLQRGCYAAIIASTGWDSFPRSGMEMQASGLPVLVSDLPGLRESIEDNVSGFLFPTGDADALANAMERLLDEPALRDRLAAGARARVETGFTEEVQLRNLTTLVRRLVSA
jgi:glycosyltransferase involved in cell wall biosynthesis